MLYVIPFIKDSWNIYMARQLAVPVLQEEKIVVHHNRLSKIILSVLHIAAYQNDAVNSAVPYIYQWFPSFMLFYQGITENEESHT